MNNTTESRQVQELATIAISLSPSNRNEFVRNSAEGDTSLEREIMRLVKCHLKNKQASESPNSARAENLATDFDKPESRPPHHTYEFTAKQLGLAITGIVALFVATTIGWSISSANSQRQNETLSNTVRELSQDLDESYTRTIRSTKDVRTATQPANTEKLWR